MAKRKNYTSKADRDRFHCEIIKMIERFGGILIEGPLDIRPDHRIYRMNTKAGPLTVNLHDKGANSPAGVFTRFDYALTGEALVGASVPSGKWNHHFSPGQTCKEALEHMQLAFERIQPTSLDEFQDDTALLPQVIVETVLQERGAFVGYRRLQLAMCDPPYMHTMPDKKDFDGAVAWFIQHCTERLIQLWDINPQIHLLLEGEGSRDVAYAFVHHWLDAYLNCPPEYRKKHPNWETPDREPMVA